MILRLFRLVAPKKPDLELGDCVHCPGEKGVGFIDGFSGDFATVTRGRGLRAILPKSLLKRARPCGHTFGRKP